MGRLQDKVVVVTGAGSGIGAAVAAACAQEGATVVVTDIDLDAAERTAAGLGDAARAHRVDVTDRGSVVAAVQAVKQEQGRIDVLVNNAGWDVGMPFVDTDPELWHKVVSINYLGVLTLCHAVLPLMVEQEGGSVVNLSSDAARVGSSGEAVYAGAKAAVIGFSKTIAREHARHGINVNVVCPGPTDTPLFASMGGDSPKLREGLTRAIPARRLATPADIANAVVFFAAPESAYITGQTLSVSGGLTMS